VGLRQRLPRHFAGYVVINSTTFSIDLLLLTTLHGAAHWPLAAAITVSYATAFTLSYALNRRFNFRSHAPVGGQFVVYAAVVVVNYLALILGVGDGLTHAGVDYRVSRVTAGACEAVFMYCAMRWLVFRDVLTPMRADVPGAHPSMSSPEQRSGGPSPVDGPPVSLP